ncbi:MAG: multicopper oxidase type 3 [Pedosphaera sp.]|nr:multicopper oxidase type 3 [Pedosphaera sp.]
MAKGNLFGKAAVLMVLATALFTVAGRANPLSRVTNVSTHPALTNEFYLTATNIIVNIHGTNVHALIYADDPPGGGGAARGLPGPLIELNVGQMVVCHFRNNLANNIEGASIHWHGIELDNDSDGTAVTQDTILPGQTYTYRFVVPRAGLYWYHSHMLPGTTTFGGMYGPIIVHDTNETALVAANILPSTNYTFPLALSDVSFTNGVIGKVMNGTNYSLNTLIQLCENSILGLPNANGGACGVAGPPGDVFLCNGTVPSLSGTFCAPATNSAPVFYIGKNQRIRLQLFNDSISRNCYLTLHYPCSNPTGNTNLYHIGGQGGLLDNAVLDGGVQSGYNFQYPSGTINLGSGMRSDVMFYSSGNNGDVIQLVGNPTAGQWKLSAALTTNYPVAFFVITNGGSTNLPLAAGSPILSAVGAAVDNLHFLNTNALAPPPASSLGTQSGAILFKNGIASNGVVAGPNIGGYAATALDGNSGYGSWPYVPHPPTTLWARAGDVLQLAIVNDTGAIGGGGGSAAHPYHLHGFSMQPVSIYSANLQTNLYNFPFNQFVDTYDVYPGEALVFRIKLADRPIFADTATGGPLTLATDSATGGNVGRWLMHCHIFLHGTIGMISELTVIPNTVTRLVGSPADTNSVILVGSPGTAWTATTNVPWLHILPGYESGSGSSIVPFSYDANPGATRVGNLNVGGETVVVTQAGTNYVQVPGPVTVLSSNNISGPTGIGVDGTGNVYFSDSSHGAIKKWTLSNNTVSTLVSGIGLPQGLALDRLGNVYFADFQNTVVKMWSASTHGVYNVFTNNTTGISGMAVDAAGNVYITVPSQNVAKKWTTATGTLSTLYTNGLNGPYGVAVDAAGTVYVADTGNDAVKRLVTIFFHGAPLYSWNTLVSSNNLSSPWNLAVDDGGNIYIADGYHNAIKRWNAAKNTVDTLVSSGLGDPTGVAADNVGNVYISDYNNGAIKELPYAFVDPSPKHEWAEVTSDTLPPILLASENLLPPFAPTPNQFWTSYNGSSNGIINFSVGANLGAPRSGTITVLGQNITINQDGPSYALGTTSLLVGPAAGSNTVTEAVIPSVALWSANTTTPWLHLPFASGTGSGNILFTYNQNLGPTRTGTININGLTLTVTQAGSNYIQAPGPLTTLVSAGLVNPVDVAVDSAGNVVFSDSGNNTVKKWAPGSLTAATLISSGIGVPQGVGLDAAGNIYVADFNGQAIKQWRASDSSVITLVDCSPLNPSGLSLGYSTNVYWSNPGNDSVSEWIAADSNSVSIVATNLNGPYGLAVDVAGFIYIADTYNNAVKKWNPAAGALTTLGTTGLNNPWNVAVDGSGNVYVANGFNNNIVEWVAASGNFVTLVPGGLSDPTGVSVDVNQNLYIADFGNAAIKELPHAFMDPSAKSEPAAAGSDSLAMVLPPNQNLLAQFAPTVNQPWLNIVSTAGGVVSFNFTANTNTLARAASISLLGQNILVSQAAAVYPPAIINPSMPTNGVFQFGFTNGTRGATYSVLFTTNVTTPLTNWTVIGAASQVGPSLWQFTDTQASNQTRFYLIRSP